MIEIVPKAVFSASRVCIKIEISCQKGSFKKKERIIQRLENQ